MEVTIVEAEAQTSEVTVQHPVTVELHAHSWTAVVGNRNLGVVVANSGGRYSAVSATSSTHHASQKAAVEALVDEALS